MSEKKPDTPVVHLPWSSWQDITARLDALEADVAALEAREKARDMLLLALADGVMPTSLEAGRLISAKCFDLGCAVAESKGSDTAYPAPPPPAAPDVIERAMKVLRHTLTHARDPEVLSDIRLALRLLGARS